MNYKDIKVTNVHVDNNAFTNLYKIMFYKSNRLGAFSTIIQIAIIIERHIKTRTSLKKYILPFAKDRGLEAQQ